MGDHFPQTRDLSILKDRFEVVFQSPELGTCWAGYCCDICDGKIYSGFRYTKEEARQVAERMVKSDALSQVWVRGQ